MSENRTIPTKQQVLEAAEKCPQTKKALKILFPKDFTDAVNWDDVDFNPTKYIHISTDTDVLALHPAVAEAVEFDGWKAGKKPGYPSEDWQCLHLTLKQMADVLIMIKNKIR